MKEYKIDKEKLMKFVRDEVDRLNGKQTEDDIMHFTSAEDRKVEKRMNREAVMRLKAMKQSIGQELFFEGEKYIKEVE